MTSTSRDEFSDLPISRQRRYQLRRRRDGLCIRCGVSAVDANFCEAHRQRFNVMVREHKRRRLGCVRRNFNSESYNYASAVNLPARDHLTAFFTWLRISEPQFPLLSRFFAFTSCEPDTGNIAPGSHHSALRSGVPNTFLPVPRDGRHGLWIEFKAQKNTLASEQSDWEVFLEEQGYQVYVVRDWIEAACVTLAYLGFTVKVSR